MDVKRLKIYIVENEKVEDILKSIGCGHVRYHASSNYYTACNKNGDNQSAVVVYNNEKLITIDYTRSIVKGDRTTDLFDLVCYNLDCSFAQGLKHVTNVLGIDYYHDFSEDLPESVLLCRMLQKIGKPDVIEEKPLKPISEQVLKYYKPYVNKMFYKDGISYKTQQDFEIGYDECTNRITIPIRDEIGTLVGVKGRLFKEKLDKEDTKYMYLEPTPKSSVLYGLYKNYDDIVTSGCVYVTEAEKGVMQLYSYGYKNCVATGGKTISRRQINMLFRLGIKIIFAFDKDVKKEELKEIANRFIKGCPVYCVYDKDDILDEKESPMDNKDKWNTLVHNNIYRIR